LILIQNIILAFLLFGFFYLKYYKSLLDDSYLFPQGIEDVNLDSDIAKLNKNYIKLNGYLRDSDGNRMVSDRQFGIEASELDDMLSKNPAIKIIDVREIEEFNAGHILSSSHYRVMDLSIEIIKNIFSCANEEFNNTLFVLVCHDGGRGYLKAKEFNKKNIKYLIGGIESISEKEYENLKLTGPVFADYKIFDKKYQYKFQILADRAINLINTNKDILLIDGRHITFYEKKHLSDSIHMKIGHMTSEEYSVNLKKIVEKKGEKVIIIADRYSELFYANLLILRLINNYEFSEDSFNVLFNQFDLLEEDNSLNFE